MVVPCVPGTQQTVKKENDECPECPWSGLLGSLHPANTGWEIRRRWGCGQWLCLCRGGEHHWGNGDTNLIPCVVPPPSGHYLSSHSLKPSCDLPSVSPASTDPPRHPGVRERLRLMTPPICEGRLSAWKKATTALRVQGNQSLYLSQPDVWAWWHTGRSMQLLPLFCR